MKNYKDKEGNIELYLTDFKEFLPLKEKAQTVIVDPPYNISFNYGKNYKDNIEPSEYRRLIRDVLDLSYESTKKNSSMFLINYPEIIAELFQDIKDSEWNVHQWISWVYPSNIGHSTKKFTTAHRAILWLVKDNPKIYMERILQPYKNPEDKRVKKLIKEGKKGTHLYNWWEINLVKNVSKDKKLYVNQIPREVLNRLILTTTNKGDLILDPMCGTGSAIVAAADLQRRGIGTDLNKDLIKIWSESIKDFDSRLKLE